MATKIPEPISTQVNDQDIIHPQGSTDSNMASNLTYLQKQQQESSKYDDEVEQFTLYKNFQMNRTHILVIIGLLLIILYLCMRK